VRGAADSADVEGAQKRGNEIGCMCKEIEESGDPRAKEGRTKVMNEWNVSCAGSHKRGRRSKRMRNGSHQRVNGNR
jgi:hypothetical protein